MKPPKVTPQALALAAKIQRMAAEPVEGLVRRMTLLGLGPDHQAIVLEELVRCALRARVACAEALQKTQKTERGTA